MNKNDFILPKNRFSNVECIIENMINFYDIGITKDSIYKSLKSKNSFEEISKVLAKWKIKLSLLNYEFKDLHKIKCPIISYVQIDNEAIFIIIYKIDSEFVSYFDTQSNSFFIKDRLIDFELKFKKVIFEFDYSKNFREENYLKILNTYKSKSDVYKAKLIEVPNFLNKEDCNLILRSAENGFSESMVISNNDINPTSSNSRKSQTAILNNEEELILTLENKLRKIIGRKVFIESFHCTKYFEGNYFDSHYDFVKDNERSNRKYTLLIYLNHDFKGGETYFPLLDIKITPQLGLGLIFQNSDENCKIEEFSLHSSLPVCNGVKYIVSVWFN